MTKSRIITAAVLASGLFAVSTAGLAAQHAAPGVTHAVHVSSGSDESGHQARIGHGKDYGDRHFDSVMKRLDFTPEQREQVREIVRQDADERQARFEELRQVQRELHRGSYGPGFDPSRIGELAQRQGALMAELHVMRAERMNVIYQEVLTDAQRAKLDEWRASGMERKHHEHGYGHRHGKDRTDRPDRS